MRSKLVLLLVFLLFSTIRSVEALNIDLNKAIELALEKNAKLKQALASVEAAKAKVMQAEKILYPTIDFQTTKTERGGASKSFPEFPSSLNPTPEDIFLYNFMKSLLGTLSSSSTSEYQTKISLTYPLYLGGKKSSTIKSAKESLFAELENLRQVKNEVLYSVAEAYYNLLKAKSAYSIAIDGKKLLEAHLEEVKARFNVGMTTRSDLIRAEVAVASAELDVIKAENALRVAELNLKFSIGLNRDDEIEVKEELAYSPLRGELKEFLEEAFSKRPEILSISHLVEALKANEKSVLAEYKPQIYLSGSYQWSGDSFPPDRNSWSVALILSLNIFDGGEKESKLREIKANIKKLEATLENLKKSIALQVESAYLSVKEAEKRIKVAGAQVEKAYEDFKMSEEEYKAGVGTNLDVLDAQTAWKEMKNSYVQALYDFNVAVAKLILAIGRDRFESPFKENHLVKLVSFNWMEQFCSGTASIGQSCRSQDMGV